MSHSDMPAPLCDDDFVLWMEHQIQLLRDQQFSQLDLPHLLAQLECTVCSEKRQLAGSLRLVITHLLKCECQPWRRSPSWVHSIVAHRNRIEDLLEASPSLARQIVVCAEKEYQRALRLAVADTGLPKSTFPTSLPFTEAQLMDHDFIPTLSGN